MSEALIIFLTVLAGFGLGAVFFGGLWWTVRMCVSSSWAPLWFVGSLVLRSGTVLAGFYLVSGNRWEHLAACLLGFVAARSAVTRLTRLPEKQPHLTPEV